MAFGSKTRPLVFSYTPGVYVDFPSEQFWNIGENLWTNGPALN